MKLSCGSKHATDGFLETGNSNLHYQLCGQHREDSCSVVFLGHCVVENSYTREKCRRQIKKDYGQALFR